MTEFVQLLNRGGVNARPGASAADVATFERETGLVLSPDLRAMYSRANGVRINSRGALELLPLDRVASYISSFHSFGIPDCWGYFPFTDLNDSNPHCVCLAGPATGYVVRVFHDDTAALEYRSPRSFMRTVRDVIDMDEDEEGAALWDLPRELRLNATDRTPADDATAHQLLSFAATLEEGSIERADAERWALTLFSEAEVAEVVRLLETGDEYRRGEALQKLGAMTVPQAASALQHHRSEMRTFVRQVADALGTAGLTVAEVRGESVRVEPGRVHLNVPVFFTRRRSPTIMADIVQRVRELIAHKTQGNA